MFSHAESMLQARWLHANLELLSVVIYSTCMLNGTMMEWVASLMHLEIVIICEHYGNLANCPHLLDSPCLHIYTASLGL